MGAALWPTWRQYHAEQIAAFLEFGSPPNKEDAVEVYHCGCSEDAANLIDSGALLVIDNQQPFAWNGPPLNDCFQRLSAPECLRRLQLPDLARNGRVSPRSFNEIMTDQHWVTISTRSRDTINAKGQVIRQSTFFQKTLPQIKKKLLNGTGAPKDEKWNVLNMPQWVPVPYPPFLTNPNSDILRHIDALERTGAGPAVLSGRNIEFMLLSEVFRKLSDPPLITGGELSETEPEVTSEKAGNWVACLVELVKQRREAQDWDNIPDGREELELVMKTLEVGSAITWAEELLT
ncbi:hypothetical protein F52700_4863 [Fusarium sp. NRRL 52700]|nr:hypothetical protein F52700_4863 [Fusarium sp. NRRL 52700]